MKARKSFRETLEENNKALKTWAAAFGAPIKEGMLAEVKPKRERKPAEKVGRGSEHAEQVAVIAWWYKWHKEFGAEVVQLFAIPNGGSRDVITGARLKAEGVRRGTPDLFLAVPYGGKAGLFLEMKYNKGRCTEEQLAFIEMAEKAGYHCNVCWTAEAAISAIKRYFGRAE
jgi:hypothetical protein